MATSKPSSGGVTSTTRSDRALQHGRGPARKALQSASKIDRTNRRTGCAPSSTLVGSELRLALAASSRSLIADNRATLVAYPIPEAQIVDPHVVKSGAHRRCGAERGSSAAFAMRHDMIARA